MELSFEAPEGETLKDFVKVFWAAFEPPEADMIVPMIFYGGLTPDVAANLENLIKGSITKDPRTFFILARDTETGKLIGISSWTTIEHAAQTMEEIDSEYVKNTTGALSSGEAPVKVMNVPLARAQHKAGIYAEKTSMLGNGGAPYGVLKLLAVDPGHHRRGIASRILTEGLRRMDALQLPVYLDCGIQGKPLYERFGFKYVQDYPLDAREYGGRSEGKHWCLLRGRQGD